MLALLLHINSTTRLRCIVLFSYSMAMLLHLLASPCVLDFLELTAGNCGARLYERFHQNYAVLVRHTGAVVTPWRFNIVHAVGPWAYCSTSTLLLD